MLKVLGYTIKDNLTRKDAITLFKEFKDSVVLKPEKKLKKKYKTGKELASKDKDSEIVKKLQEENQF